MRNAQESIWIGLVEVYPLENSEVLRGVSGAFVNVLTWASNTKEFETKTKTIMGSLGLVVVDVEDAEPIAARGFIESEEIRDIENRVKMDRKAVMYSTFDTWHETAM